MSKLLLALAISIAALPICRAADMAPLTIYRVCMGQVAANDRMWLHFWSPEVAQGNTDPICVLRKPELAGLPVRSARVGPSPLGVGAVAIIGLDESARPLIEQMTRRNKGNLVVFVVDQRVVSLAMITQAYADSRIFITTLTRADADEIVSTVLRGEHGKDR
ncbi:MAG: hypothetical protein ABL877_11235 [Thiobacillus sp.]